MKKDPRISRTVRLDEETHWALNERALKERVKAHEIIVRLIKEYLNGSV